MASPNAAGAPTARTGPVTPVKPPPVPPQRPDPPARSVAIDRASASVGPSDSMRAVASEAAAIAARGLRRRTASVPERDLLLVASELARTVGRASVSGAASGMPNGRSSKRTTTRADPSRQPSSSNGASPASSDAESDDSVLDDGLSDDDSAEGGSDAMAAVTMLRRLRGLAALTGGKAEIGIEDLDILTNIVQGVAYGAADQGTFEHAMTQHFVHNPDVFDHPEVKSFLMAQYIPHHGSVGSFGAASQRRTVRALAAAGGLRPSLGGATGLAEGTKSRSGFGAGSRPSVPAASKEPARESDVIAATGIGGQAGEGTERPVDEPSSATPATGHDNLDSDSDSALAEASGIAAPTADGDETPLDGPEDHDRQRSRTADASIGLPRQHAQAQADGSGAADGSAVVGSDKAVPQGAWLGSRRARGRGLLGTGPVGQMSMSMRALPLPPSASKLGIRPAVAEETTSTGAKSRVAFVGPSTSVAGQVPASSGAGSSAPSAGQAAPSAVSRTGLSAAAPAEPKTVAVPAGAAAQDEQAVPLLMRSMSCPTFSVFGRSQERLGDLSQADALGRLLDGIDRWNFDVFAAAEFAPARILSIVAQRVLNRQALPLRLNLDRKQTAQWVLAIENTYRDNLYHTRTHVADVTQSCHFLISNSGGGMQGWMTDIQRLAMLLAAIAHDAGHVGVNNAYLVATGHPLAIRYNDQSPLENMHAATAFAAMRKPGQDLLCSLTDEDRRAVRKDVIALILGTDNALHFKNLGRLTSKLEAALADKAAAAVADSAPGAASGGGGTGGAGGSSATSPPKQPQKSRRRSMLASRRGSSAGLGLDVRSDPEVQQLVMLLALHAADVSNPAKPWDLYIRWTDRVIAEFYDQGDKEAEAGLPVTPIFNRHKPIPLPKFQLGFINAIVLPLYQELNKVKGVDCSVPLSCLDSNIARWKSQL